VVHKLTSLIRKRDAECRVVGSNLHTGGRLHAEAHAVHIVHDPVQSAALGGRRNELVGEADELEVGRGYRRTDCNDGRRSINLRRDCGYGSGDG
jgi:hypothetical protein